MFTHGAGCKWGTSGAVYTEYLVNIRLNERLRRITLKLHTEQHLHVYNLYRGISYII